MHLMAMAREAGVDLTLEDFTRIGAKSPVLADVKPSGKYLMSELIAIGGIQPLMKRLLDRGLLHGDCLTVTGNTLAENLAGVQDYPDGQDVVRDFDDPIKPESHLVIMYGNLAPEGAVAKITGKEGLRFVITSYSIHYTKLYDDGTQVLLSLRRMDRIRSLDADDFTIVAEAGCTLSSIQAAADEAGRFFPLSLAAEGSCQIGGNLSTNAGGINVLRFV